MSSTFKRIISALVFVPIFIYFVFSRYSLPLFLLISSIMFLGLLEFYSLAAKKQKQGGTPLQGESPLKSFKIIGVITSLALASAAYWTPTQFYLLSLLLMSPLLIGYLFTLLTKRYFLEVGWTLAGVLYTGYLISHLLLLKNLPNGSFYFFLLLLITWITDAVALGIGLKFGRHKLVPHISPKKSVEGALAGLIGGVLISVLANLVTGLFAEQTALSINHALILGLTLGFSGQVGDLLESKLKRLASVKDSHDWIPGHGGVLDVFDSVIFNAPIIYWYVIFFL
ncbi:MAG: phosphatidate cytidylyltransferase [bacterium]|nr:phosphatidate cytidylyltransferase [bacterium]